MSCQIHEVFGQLANALPDGPPGEQDFVFHKGVLPPPPRLLTTDRIVIRKLLHTYDSWFRADMLWMYLSASTCRELGLFLLACAFHGPGETVSLALHHPDSAIRQIKVRAARLALDAVPVGLSMQPFALRYFPSETSKHPWLDMVDPGNLPALFLSNQNECLGDSDAEWQNRDTVWISPSTGTVRLAELLLNAGCSWNPVREYELEGEAGFRGVAPMSAELRIFLPGSDGFLYDWK